MIFGQIKHQPRLFRLSALSLLWSLLESFETSSLGNHSDGPGRGRCSAG